MSTAERESPATGAGTVGGAGPRRPGLSAQVFIALGLGILAGLFFGELITPVRILGDIFIGLLQMTVLPYILVSLIAGIGKLSYREMRVLALQGGRFVLLFWAIALGITWLFTLAFPDWESATFFSSSLVESESHADFVALYVPSNPFFSLSSGIVPAIVVFSLAVGVALIGTTNKSIFIDNLDVIAEAIMRIATAVARLAPIGVFALIATTAGTLDVEALGRLQVYILAYIGSALLLSFWVLPALVGALTPIPPKRMLRISQDALVTAFATGSLLIVLPLLSERLKELLGESGIGGQEAESAVDLVVPINFNLPNLGKLLALAFVPFAGWFAGTPVSADNFPTFMLSGLVSFFGEVVFALPFLLNLMHIPADLFELFIAVDVFTGRFGTLLAGVHTIALAVLTAAAIAGHARVNWFRLSRFTVLSVVLATLLFGGLRFFFEVVIPQEYREYDKLVQMDLAVDRVKSRAVDLAQAGPPDHPERRLAAIRDRGTLRVGYLRNALPFIYRNENGEIVGLEADLAHLLAGQLGVDLDFVRVERDEMADQLRSGRIDVMMSGLMVTPDRATEFRFTDPYLNSTLGLVVPDYQRDRFDTNAELRELEGVTIAVLDLPYYSRFLERNLSGANIVTVNSARDFFRAEPGRFDAMLYSAEASSAWTLIYPRYTVVVPKPNTVAAPIALALPRAAPQLFDFVQAWLMLQHESGAIEQLRRYWILGEGTEEEAPRWSILRDILGWSG